MKFKEISVLVIFAVSALFIFVFVVLISANEFSWDSFFALSFLLLRGMSVLTILLFAIAISLVSAVIYSIKRWLKRQEYLKKNWKESLAEGGVKNQQIERMLNKYEKYQLESLYKETKDQKYDLDRRSPIFKVQGPLYKEERRADPMVEVEEKWFVNGVGIDEDNYHPIKFRDFNEGDELVVEFSPYSKYVWDVYKVVNGHRNWCMYLNEEIFDQVLVGKIEVLGRAPYGNHNLDQIKVNDIITFTRLVTGRRLDTKVESNNHYGSIQEMTSVEGMTNILPEAKSEQEVINFYESLYDYKSRINNGGIYAFRISLLNGN